MPNIKHIDHETKWHDDKLSFFEQVTNFRKKNYTVLYIPSIFISDGYFDGKLIDSHNTYNWLIKLSKFFKKNKINFKVKFHPSRKPPNQYTKFFKNNISNYSLAKSIDNSSLIITDQPSSSSFAASIISNKPIIFKLKVHEFSDLLCLLKKDVVSLKQIFLKKV